MCHRPLRYWLGGCGWDPIDDLNGLDRKDHEALFSKFVKDSRAWTDPVCLRQVPLATREEMLRGVAEGMMFSPRDPQLAAMHAGITASIAASASDKGGTSAEGRQSSTRSRDEADLSTPKSSRAARKRHGRR